MAQFDKEGSSVQEDKKLAEARVGNCVDAQTEEVNFLRVRVDDDDDDGYLRHEGHSCYAGGRFLR